MGLLDALFQQNSGSGGLLGGVGLGSNSLIQLGAGIAGGSNWGDSVSKGLTGLAAGKTADQRRQLFAQAMQPQAGAQGQPATPGAGPDLSRLSQTLLASGDIEGAKSVADIAGKNQTDELKEYATYVSQTLGAGQKPMPFFNFKTALKQAGATRVSQNVNSGEKAYDVEMGKNLANANVDLIKGASTARTNIANLDRLEQALSDPSVYQGLGAEKILQLKRLAQSAGVNVEGVADAEVAQSITNQLALNARNPAGGAGMPGAMSDQDREYLKAMQPGIDKTAGGNRAMIDVNRKLQNRSIEIDNLRQQYIRKNGRLDEGFYRSVSDYANANPLFAGQKSPPTSAGWTDVGNGVRIREKK